MSDEKNIVGNLIFEQIRQSIDAIDFGNILIKVHAGKVVQIEVTEKKRFEDLWELQDGGGI